MIQRETLKLEKPERLVTVTMGSSAYVLPFKLIKGFDGPSKDKRWTIGTEATLRIPKGNAKEKISKIILDAQSITVSEKIPQKLIIQGKGIKHQEYLFTMSNRNQKVVINFPLDRKEDIDITLNMPNACSLFDINPNNEDKRIVSLSFTSVDVIYTDIKLHKLTLKYNKLQNTIKTLNISYKEELQKKDAALEEQKQVKSPDMISHLMTESLAGNLTNVDHLLQLDGDLKININAKNEEGFTPLLQAALSGNKQLVKLLLTHNADPYSIDIYGNSILDHLVEHANAEMLQFLIDEMSPLRLFPLLANAWKNCQTISPINPIISKILSNNMLRCAVKQGHLEHVKLTLNTYDADINYQDHSLETALHKACYYSHVEIVEFLLAQGAKTNIEDQYQQKPANVISTNEFHDTILYLFNYYEFLQLVKEGNIDLVGYYLINHPDLLLGNLSLEKQQKLFAAALDLRLSHERIVIINLLFNTPFAEGQLKKPNSDLLLRQTYGIEDKEETSPLHMAIFKNDPSTVKLLIKLGASIDDKANNMTAVEYARSLHHHDLADLMIAKFAKEKYKRKHGGILAVPCAMFANKAALVPANADTSDLSLSSGKQP